MKPVTLWKLLCEAMRYFQLAAGGVLLVLILWSQFILAKSPWEYLYLFAWIELIDILRDVICYCKKIPNKQGDLLSRDRLIGRTAQNLVGAFLSTSIAHSNILRLR